MSSLTQSSQKLVASWESPQLHTDGHLDGQQREVLLLLSCLQLHENLVELQAKGAGLLLKMVDAINGRALFV